ncbi:MAG: hypothetical protein ABI597_11040 [Gammaproteobacteria bacterium]
MDPKISELMQAQIRQLLLNRPPALTVLLETLVKDTDFTEAFDIANKLVKSKQFSSTVYFDLAKILEKYGHLKLAMSAYKLVRTDSNSFKKAKETYINLQLGLTESKYEDNITHVFSSEQIDQVFQYGRACCPQLHLDYYNNISRRLYFNPGLSDELKAELQFTQSFWLNLALAILNKLMNMR